MSCGIPEVVMSSPAVFTTLPHELLAYIFEFILPINPFRGNYREYIRTVTRISAVCLVWRLVAIGTASLWTWIAVGNELSEEGPEKTSERLVAFLDRSKMVPLELSIGRVNKENTLHASCIVMAPHFERCRTLRVETFDRVKMTTLWDALRATSFPLLESFLLSDAPLPLLDNTSGAPEDLFWQKELPRLKTLIYRSDHPSTPPVLITPSIQTLALYLPHLTCEQTISTVANYISLVSLVIKLIPWNDVSLPVQIVLPALAILVTDSPALLANFATPSLLMAKFEDVTTFGWLITPVVTPIGSDIFMHMGCLLSLEFTNCDVSFRRENHSPPRGSSSFKSPWDNRLSQCRFITVRTPHVTPQRKIISPHPRTRPYSRLWGP